MFMVRSLSIISAVALFAAAGLADNSSRARATDSGASLKPFLGKWQLDKKKSAAKGGPEDLQCELKESDGGLLIKSKYQEPKNAMYPLLWVGVMTYELPLSVDGSDKTNQIGPFQQVAKTTIDGNKMTTDWTAHVANGENKAEGAVQGQWIRTVSDDGKEMTLHVIAKSSDGRNLDQTLYFRRK
jgi:hypothetical protein